MYSFHVFSKMFRFVIIFIPLGIFLFYFFYLGFLYISIFFGVLFNTPRLPCNTHHLPWGKIPLTRTFQVNNTWHLPWGFSPQGKFCV